MEAHLLGLIQQWHLVRERAQIEKYLAVQRSSAFVGMWPPIFATLWPIAVVTFGLFGLVVWADTSVVLPNQEYWPSWAGFVRLFIESGGAVGVFPIVSGLAAGLGAIAISASMVLLNSASQRFPASTVEYLMGPASVRSVLEVIYLTFIFSVLSLFLKHPGYLVTACSTLLALVSIAAVVSYLRQVSLLFHPVGVAQRFAEECIGAIDSAAVLPGRNPGESVLNHLQQQVRLNIARLDDLLTMLVARRHFKEASDALLWLGYILQHYLFKRRLVPPDSAWYPKLTVAAPENEVDWSIRHINEQLALGPVTTPVAQRDWLERSMLGLLTRVASTARRRGNQSVIRSATEVITHLAIASWREQELETVKGILALFDTIVNASPDEELGTTGALVLDKLTLVGDIAGREGFGLGRLHGIEVVVYSPKKYALFSLGLPTIIQQELVSYQEKLSTERLVAGNGITPLKWVVEDMHRRLLRAEAEALADVAESILAIERTIEERALNCGQGKLAASFTMAALQLSERLQVHGRTTVAEALLPSTVRSLPQVLVACEDPSVLTTILRFTRVATLQAISKRQVERAEILVPSLVRCMARILQVRKTAEVPADRSGLQPETETVLVLGGLSYLASEFTSDPMYLGLVTNAVVQEGLQLAGLSSAALPLLDNPSGWYGTYGSRLDMEYDRFFRPYFQEIGDLPRVAEPADPLSRGFRSRPDHRSSFIQRCGRFGDLRMEDCIAGFLRSLSGTESQPDEAEATDED
jgi:hypothetical protein